MIAAFLARLARIISGAHACWLGDPPDGRARVYFANHASHLDFVVLWASLPTELRRTTRPVAARDYWDRNRLRRYLARRVFRAILIERERVKSTDNPLDMMIAALDAGDSLIVFPEGTRNTGPEMRPFKSGLFHLARKRPGIDLHPVYLENLNRILPKGEILPVPLLGSVTIGAAIRLGEGEKKGAFLERARNAIRELGDR